MSKARALIALDPHALTAKNARIILRVRLNEMYSYAKYTNTIDSVQELHDLRIATKRTRYTMEIFENFLPSTCKKFLPELAQLQEELGALHDSEVLLVLLELSLQRKKNGVNTKEQETAISKTRKALLSSDMALSVLKPSKEAALSSSEHEGLSSFLHRQELHRQDCYAAFLTHWNQLEQNHFRAEILKVLMQEDEDEKK